MTRLMTTALLLAAAVLPVAITYRTHAELPEGLQSVDLLGEQPGHSFGKRVANLGDVNGNGYDDIAISAPYANDGAGMVFIYFGGPTFFNDEPDVILHGQAANDQFGMSITGGMDLNGSGYRDIAVGARFSDLGASNAGAVFIFFGGPSISTTPSLILKGEAADDWFGQSVAGAGDVNGDGYDDLVVGAPYNDDVGNAAGKAYVFFGGQNMNDQPDVMLYGAATNHAHFGWSVSGTGDVNGDGYGDVIVGARMHGTGPLQATGRAYIYHGAAQMNSTADVIIDGEFPHDWFGESVSGAGDVNGDGYADIIVGANFADPNGSASGKASVYFGGASMNTAPAFTFAGPHADAQLGSWVSGAGDVDGSGYDDVIIGAHFANIPGAPTAGKAYVIFGGEDPSSNVADLVLSGSHADEQFGESVSAAGRVTGSAPDAFLVGAHFNNSNGNGAGRAAIFRIESQPVLGDLNGDGVVDVSDLLILLAAWGDCPSSDPCPAELNGDDAVDVADLLILLANWG